MGNGSSYSLNALVRAYVATQNTISMHVSARMRNACSR